MSSLSATPVGAAADAAQVAAVPPPAQTGPAQEAPAPAKVTGDAYVAETGSGVVESHFSVDPNTHETVVRVVDAETQEVIRELPSESIRNMMASIESFIGKQMDAKV